MTIKKILFCVLVSINTYSAHVFCPKPPPRKKPRLSSANLIMSTPNLKLLHRKTKMLLTDVFHQFLQHNSGKMLPASSFEFLRSIEEDPWVTDVIMFGQLIKLILKNEKSDAFKATIDNDIAVLQCDIFDDIMQTYFWSNAKPHTFFYKLSTNKFLATTFYCQWIKQTEEAKLNLYLNIGGVLKVVDGSMSLVACERLSTGSVGLINTYNAYAQEKNGCHTRVFFTQPSSARELSCPSASCTQFTRPTNQQSQAATINSISCNANFTQSTSVSCQSSLSSFLHKS